MRSRGIIGWAFVVSLAVGCAGPPPAQESPELTLDLLGSIPERMPVPMHAMFRNLRQHTKRARPGQILDVSVSPDGNWFAYASTEDRGLPQVYVQAEDAVVARQITGSNSRNLFPRISPNGKYIAYASDRFGSWDVFVSRIDAPASVIQVTDDDHDNLAPSWSPDGRNLVYCSKWGDLWKIVIVDWQSRIKTYLGPGMYPDWGKQNLIAFQTQPLKNNPRVGIRIVQPDGKNLTNVHFDHRGIYSAVRPRWAPDGRWLVFGVLDGNPAEEAYSRDGRSKDLWVVKSDGTGSMALTGADIGEEWGASWGGDRIFFISSHQQGYENVFSMEPLLFDPEQEQEGR